MRSGTYSVTYVPPAIRLPDKDLHLPEYRRPGGDEYALHPGDIRNTALVIERCYTGCWGLNGWDGPNLSCTNCGALVGSRIDDCACWQETRLEAKAVRLLDLPAQSGTEVYYPGVDAPAIDRARWRRHKLAGQFYNDELTPADTCFDLE